MRIEKANKRDRLHRKRTKGIVIDGRSVFLLEEIQRKKAEKAQRKIERRLHKDDSEEEQDDSKES